MLNEDKSLSLKLSPEKNLWNRSMSISFLRPPGLTSDSSTFCANLGVVDVIRAFLPILGHATSSAENLSVGITNVTSRGGIWPLPRSSLYCTSKYVVEAFTESLPDELAPQNLS